MLFTTYYSVTKKEIKTFFIKTNLKLQISLQNIPRSGITRPNGMNILKLPIHIAKLLSKKVVPVYTPTSDLGECLVSF